MTYRTAGRTTKTTKSPVRRTKKTTVRNAKSRAPKSGRLFTVPVAGHRGTVPSAWYFGY